jgi:hypothetical protein
MDSSNTEWSNSGKRKYAVGITGLFAATSKNNVK